MKSFFDLIANKQRLSRIIIIIISLVYYINTIPNKYALDDSIVITKNEFTKQGLQGIGKIFSNDSFTGFFGVDKKLVTGGRYRPLSIATFAIEHQFFGLNPSVSHFINILVYALCGLLIFSVLKKLPLKKSYELGFLSALLFIIHPIHSEVVANIKGRDEILALLFSLLALNFSMKYWITKDIKWTIIAGSMLFLGLMSKENSIAFLILIPSALFFFFPKEKKKTWIYTIIPLISFTLVYLIIRVSVIGINGQEANELMNNPFLNASKSEKYGTIFYTLLIYLKLLIFPHPLTYDYYPYHVSLIEITNVKSIFSILIYSAIIIIGFILSKKKNIIGFGIIFYSIPLLIVSNIIFSVGTFMNERFIFFSSVGFCLIISQLLIFGLQNKKLNKPIGVFIILLIALSSFKTITRNKDWKDDYTLFTTDVKTSVNSAKSNCTAGGKILEEAQAINDPTLKLNLLNQSITYLEKSIRVYPDYTDALLLLGNAYWERDKDYQKVWGLYSKILKKVPTHANILSNSKIISSQINDIPTKYIAYKRLEKYMPNDYDVAYNLGHLKGRYFEQIDSSIYYLEKAIKIKPKSDIALKDLGVAYGIKGDLENSLFYLNKALELNSNDKQLYINIGVTYQRLGNSSKATEFFNKAKEFDN